MKNFKFALHGLSEHLGRTIVTVLFMALFMGTLAFTLSPVLYNAPLRYLGILSGNGVKAIRVAATDREKPIETFREYFPEEHRFFAEFGGSFGTGIAFGDTDLDSRIAGVNGMNAEDYSDTGYEAAFGKIPKRGEYAVSLALFERLKKTGLTLRCGADGAEETRDFETFEELKTLLASRYAADPETGHGYVPAPIVLSGVVDTNYDEEREAELARAVENAGKSERERAETALAEWKRTSGALYVFANLEQDPGNASGFYLTALPGNSAERKALFAAIQSNLRAHANPFGGNRIPVEIDVLEADYDREFYAVVTNGYAAATMVMPAAVVFGLLSILLMWSLSRACAKTSRSAVRARGRKVSGGYGVSLLRCAVPALIAFALSIGFAYLCRFIFASGGIVDKICASLIEGWDASGRNFVDFDYFGFLPFFLSLLCGLAIAVFGSFFGLRGKGAAGAPGNAEPDYEEF